MSSKILSVILIILVAASTVFGVLNFIGQNNLKAEMKKINEYYDYTEDVAQEDDITICGSYEVKSTKQISDAYKSGNTSGLSDRDKETLDMAKKVIKEYITDDMSSYEKEYAIYKYLTTELTFDSGLLTVIPTTEEDSDNPYGVLKNHYAVCVGYATTFRMFMQMMGIECMVCHDTEMTHTWNIIKLDGEWYHTDCYSDSEIGNGVNFNMNDTMCSENHTWNTDFFPAATGTKYNPAIMNKKEIEDVYAIPKYISEMVEEGESTFSCSFKKAITSDDEPVAEYIVNGILSTLNMSDDSYYSYIWTKDSDGNYILCIFYSEYQDYYDGDLSDETLEKANDAIMEYFPEFSEDFYEDYDEEEGFYYDECEAKG